MQTTAQVTRDWHVMDASNQVLGRLASQIAQKLIGKDKPTFTPHIDGGDYVVVTNAKNIDITGNKYVQKKYYRHSGYTGNLKQESFAEWLDQKPTKIIEKAVYNMLPKNKLRSARMNRLKVYEGSEHPHTAQVTTKK